jgi:predicted ATPase/DNA-binding CsgD family transcriptional regulator
VQRGDIRLLTLTGPGGVGKTHLALHIAADVHDTFADGARFVDLAPITEPDLVASTIAYALGVRDTGSAPVADRLAAFLRAKSLLLVLDNFEQVVEAAPFLVSLLRGCPHVMALVTSRVRLRVSGEHEHIVSPLGLVAPGRSHPLEEITRSEAVQLFVARAQLVQAAFALTPENAPVLLDICRRLDGLPLAIELAAGRIKVLPPQALLMRLERSLPLLSGGGRDLPARQQTMRTTITWSYDLLADEEQRLLRRLAVFVGGFTLEAAEAIVGRDGSVNVFDGIITLVDNSLLHRQLRGAGEDEARFHMLETVREFALEGLAASGEEFRIRQAHATWFLALAEADEWWTWGGARQTWWLDRLETDLPNLRAALAWFAEHDDTDAGARLATALWGLWHMRSLRAEGRAWLERALAHGIASDRTRVKALLALGHLYTMAGGERGTMLLDQGLALSRRQADASLMAEALFLRGNAARDRADLVWATPLLAEAATLAAELDNRPLYAQATLQLGVAVLYESGPERAEPLVAEALALHRQRQDAYQTACALLVLGWCAAMRRDLATAAARYTDSLALWEELGTQEGIVDVLAGVAELAAIIGDSERAARIFAAAETFGKELGYVVPTLEQERYDRSKAGLRAALGEAAFGTAWAIGLALPAERAIAEARGMLADLLGARASNSSPAPDTVERLTLREREVLRLVVAGRSNPEIAAALFVSRRTVTTHLTNIFAKLGVAGRAEAAVIAVRRGLV